MYAQCICVCTRTHNIGSIGREVVEGGLRVKFTLHMCTYTHTCRDSQQMNMLVHWGMGSGRRKGYVCGRGFTAQIGPINVT